VSGTGSVDYHGSPTLHEQITSTGSVNRIDE